jgi:hypothetical protein
MLDSIGRMRPWAITDAMKVAGVDSIWEIDRKVDALPQQLEVSKKEAGTR